MWGLKRVNEMTSMGPRKAKLLLYPCHSCSLSSSWGSKTSKNKHKSHVKIPLCYPCSWAVFCQKSFLVNWAGLWGLYWGLGGGSPQKPESYHLWSKWQTLGQTNKRKRDSMHSEVQPQGRHTKESSTKRVSREAQPCAWPLTLTPSMSQS